MSETISEKVSVLTLYDQTKGTVIPQRIKWKGKIYTIRMVGFHYTVRIGRKLMHYFSVATDTAVSFKLCLDTETLHWILEEVVDESSD